MAKVSSVPLIRYDLAYYGVVTQVINATTFRGAGMAGQGDGAFAGYSVYVLTKANNSITAPRGEQQTCSAYTSATGQFTHAAFTAPLSAGDAIVLLHPSIGSLAGGLGTLMAWISYPGSTTANWQAAETTICTAGVVGAIRKIHSLCVDINALIGIVTIRFYTDINGVNRQVYSQTFTVAADGPSLYLVNGTLAINGTFVVTAQSNNAADNAKAIGWEYIQGGV